MSGKRDDLEDLVIVDHERSRTFGAHKRQRYGAIAPLRLGLQFPLNTTQDDFLNGAPFLGRLGLKLPIERIRNVHGSSHIQMLPYLWLKFKNYQLEYSVPSSAIAFDPL